jgi:hypothetical protein
MPRKPGKHLVWWSLSDTAVVSIGVGVGCGAAIGWTGVGAVACGALAGAVGSAVSYGLTCSAAGDCNAKDLAKETVIGAVTGAVGGAIGGGAAGKLIGAAGKRIAAKALTRGAEDIAEDAAETVGGKAASEATESAEQTGAKAGSSAAKSPGTDLEPSPWPPNDGFMHEPVDTALKPGSRFDRFGHDGGRFVGKEGTPLPQRSMRAGAERARYSVFEVQSELQVRGGITAPAFGQPGGGIQYTLPDSVKNLLESGVIRRVQ